MCHYYAAATTDLHDSDQSVGVQRCKMFHEAEMVSPDVILKLFNYTFGGNTLYNENVILRVHVHIL